MKGYLKVPKCLALESTCAAVQRSVSAASLHFHRDMSWQALLQYAVFPAVVTVLVNPLDAYMARVFQGQKTVVAPLMRPIERLLYKLARVNPQEEMDWKQYAYCFVLFGFASTLVLYLILRVQQFLPWFYRAYMTTPMPRTWP
ncbi:MAG: hypothetical protein CXZ00_14260 [Acidobacteria bacterium]|nr:MAG: hypothetical protein CXZ00_14260 [Acidobacteriota bacterium]